MRNAKYAYILAVILFVAAIVRFVNIQSGDPIGDEVLYSFRAIGMMDFDEAEFQTTPREWFDPEVPWWTYFSFHDHPPLVFFVQHVFISAFGETVFAFRLPSAIFGVLSVFLIYRIGAMLFSPTAGLASAAVLAVTANHVFISRVGLQESYVIFFMLLAYYFFLASLRDEKKLLHLGFALGLCLLTKYTSMILLPRYIYQECARPFA
ncbi:MAG: hypothetical protein A2934_02610 [Candidatus Sungbacteria bacterium RIFCSPLOWO2_01_FULL_47_10]|uniref:Glycosyltransferase RgtA/B/C/D-like domain-containing protein n=1 Tax=Candidatus Sungbacteria bacterium RIFCSPLOWO2_01_FULL_47_10 TaxID=1802276 RepID=A0A1G2L4S3_9BACT|nr:MAG: hypothetical protein A2934_02610 [Candidatus Sungbacteria bacterium RIFCSPLOWO2_01_FULL_47_10]